MGAGQVLQGAVHAHGERRLGQARPDAGRHGGPRHRPVEAADGAVGQGDGGHGCGSLKALGMRGTGRMALRQPRRNPFCPTASPGQRCDWWRGGLPCPLEDERRPPSDLTPPGSLTQGAPRPPATRSDPSARGPSLRAAFAARRSRGRTAPAAAHRRAGHVTRSPPRSGRTGASSVATLYPQFENGTASCLRNGIRRARLDHAQGSPESGHPPPLCPLQRRGSIRAAGGWRKWPQRGAAGASRFRAGPQRLGQPPRSGGSGNGPAAR